jgi:hypothetical protein
MFFRRLSKCPIVVASSGGGYFLRVASDRPVNGGWKPFFMAVSIVLMAGEYMAAWQNATISAGVLLGFWTDTARWQIHYAGLWIWDCVNPGYPLNKIFKALPVLLHSRLYSTVIVSSKFL